MFFWRARGLRAKVAESLLGQVLNLPRMSSLVGYCQWLRIHNGGFDTLPRMGGRLKLAPTDRATKARPY